MSPDSSSSSERRRLARAVSVRLLSTRASMFEQSRASASSTTGASRCSNAQGSARSCATACLASSPALCNAASIQIASAIHGGGAAAGLRRMLANRVAPARGSARPASAAVQTATSRRWRMTGTTRRGAARRDRRRPSAPAALRNQRTGVVDGCGRTIKRS